MRGALSGLIFDKTLKISSAGGSSTVDSKEGDKKNDNTKNQSTELGAGGVINLMQSDTSIIELAAVQVHTSWDGLLQVRFSGQYYVSYVDAITAFSRLSFREQLINVE